MCLLIGKRTIRPGQRWLLGRGIAVFGVVVGGALSSVLRASLGCLVANVWTKSGTYNARPQVELGAGAAHIEGSSSRKMSQVGVS